MSTPAISGETTTNHATSNKQPKTRQDTKLCIFDNCESMATLNDLCVLHRDEIKDVVEATLSKRKRTTKRAIATTTSHSTGERNATPKDAVGSTKKIPKGNCCIEGCTKSRNSYGNQMCVKHFRESGGIMQYKLCKHPGGCKRLAAGAANGFCISHFKESGGVYKKSKTLPKCTVNGCTKRSRGKECQEMCVGCYRAQKPGVIKLKPTNPSCVTETCQKGGQGKRTNYMCFTCFKVHFPQAFLKYDTERKRKRQEREAKAKQVC